VNRAQTRFVKLVALEAKAEADMRRAFRRWEKYRGQRQRAEKSLDKEFAKRAGGGEGDIRALVDGESHLVIGQCAECFGINEHAPDCTRPGAGAVDFNDSLAHIK